uniref:YHS domain-containing protein n=1 Tax=Desulfobacca acetoxidans TaxID=60893 RepID=A0A7V4G6A9_9BACT
MNWLRILFGLLLGYLAYRLYRKFKESFALPRPTRPTPGPGEPETLVQDPVCGTFIPRKEALKLTWEGQEYFFCSEGCLKRFRRQEGPKVIKH